MRVKRIRNFGIDPPAKGAFTIDTPHDIPKLHTLMLASAKRGGGKSVAIANYVKRLRDLGLMDRVKLVSPTYYSNKSIWDICGIEEADVMEPAVDTVKQLISFVDAERAEWDMFQADKALQKKLYRDLQHRSIMQIPEYELLQYAERGLLQTRTPLRWKYAKEVPPRLMVIIDDCMGTDLMKPRAGLTNLCIKHRHVGMGLGISIVMLVQSYCAVGGVPRPIRENTTHLLLFKCKDKNQIEKIHQEIGADVDLETFDQMFEYATAEPYGFLFVDFAPKSPEQQFRKRFDEYLLT